MRIGSFHLPSKNPGDHVPDTRLGVLTAAPHVAPEQLPGVYVASNHQAVHEALLVGLPICKQRGELMLHRCSMSPAAAFQPIAELGHRPLVGKVANDEVAHLLVMVEKCRDGALNITRFRGLPLPDDAV